jgi:hypothetical protein
MTKILTVDQAFNDSNFEILEAAIFELNKNGIFDPTFLTLTQGLIDSRDSAANWNELNYKPTTVKLTLQ